jgi:hypothetical protein
MKKRQLKKDIKKLVDFWNRGKPVSNTYVKYLVVTFRNPLTDKAWFGVVALAGQGYQEIEDLPFATEEEAEAAAKQWFKK